MDPLVLNPDKTHRVSTGVMLFLGYGLLRDPIGAFPRGRGTHKFWGVREDLSHHHLYSNTKGSTVRETDWNKDASDNSNISSFKNEWSHLLKTSPLGQIYLLKLNSFKSNKWSRNKCKCKARFSRTDSLCFCCFVLFFLQLLVKFVKHF